MKVTRLQFFLEVLPSDAIYKQFYNILDLKELYEIQEFYHSTKSLTSEDFILKVLKEDYGQELKSLKSIRVIDTLLLKSAELEQTWGHTK